MEKEDYNVAPMRRRSDESPIYDSAARIVEEKGARMGEAADMYGDLETAEEYGYVSRGYVSEEKRKKEKKIVGTENQVKETMR